MTGTPAGVAMGMKEPRYLNNGDLVEVEIKGIGRVANHMVFDKQIINENRNKKTSLYIHV